MLHFVFAFGTEGLAFAAPYSNMQLRIPVCSSKALLLRHTQLFRTQHEMAAWDCTVAVLRRTGPYGTEPYGTGMSPPDRYNELMDAVAGPAWADDAAGGKGGKAAKAAKGKNKVRCSSAAAGPSSSLFRARNPLRVRT